MKQIADLLQFIPNLQVNLNQDSKLFRPHKNLVLKLYINVLLVNFERNLKK